MGYQAERDQALMELGRAGFTTRQARQLLSLGTTLHRLAEGQCNGDYPYNGSRDAHLHGDTRERREAWQGKYYGTCDRCEAECARSRMGRAGKPAVCPDCRAQDRVRAILKDGPTRPVPLPTGGYPCSCGHAVAPWDVICSRCGAPEPIKLAPTGPAWVPKFAGDPRGCVCWIYPAGTPEADIENGRARSSGIAIVGRY